MRIPHVALALLAACGFLVVGAAPALAYPPVETVHTERVQAGPYEVTVGFSVWPLRAMQSLDFSFLPEGGIEGKSGTLAQVSPEGREYRPRPLARHPRAREVWGLDIYALQQEGAWTFRFTIDGPRGQGTGELANLVVLEQPGPPMGLSWAISTLPLIGLVTFLAIAWRRTRARLAAPA